MSEQVKAKQKKHRKMSRKKKVLFTVLCVVLVVVVGVAILFAVGAKGSTETILPNNTVNICMTPPKDGSKPEEYSATTNVGYIIGRLSERTFYHTDSTAEVSATTMGINVRQDIYATKDYKDGVMITSQVSVSGNETFAPSKAMQKFFGESSVVVRNAASDRADDWNGADTEWGSGAPSAIYTNDEYLAKYGLPATEICDFIINEETIVSESEVTFDASTGLYSLTVDLDTTTSVAYYLNNMRTMGNLSTNPEFKTVRITFRFQEDWSVVSMDILEEYDTYVSLFTAATTGKTTVTFSYDEADADVSDYEEYFINYATAAPTGDEEQETNATTYFTEGFASVLNDRSVFAVDAVIAGEPVSGDILLDMSMSGETFAINALQVQLGDLAISYEGDALYVQYKDLTGKLAADDLSSLFGSLLGGAEGGFDANALLGELLGGTLTETETSATLSSTLSLGSLEIPVEFGFAVSQDAEGNRQIDWSYIDASLSAAGVDVSLHVAPESGEDTSFTQIDTENAVDLAAYVNDILALVAGKDYRLTAAYADGGLSVAADLRVQVLESGFALAGTLDVLYGDLSLPLNVTLAGDTVYLSLYNVKLSATFEELETAVEKVVQLAGLTLPSLGGTQIDIPSLVAQLLRIDYNSVIEELTLTDSALTLKVNADEILSALLGEETGIGTVTAAYTMGEGFAAEVMGAALGFTASGETGAIAAPADKDGYVPLSELLAFVDPVAEMIEAQSVAFELNTDVTVEGIKLNLSADGKVNFANGVQLYCTLTAGSYDAAGALGKLITLQLAYADGKLYVLFEGAAAYITESDLSRYIALLSGGETDTAAALSELLSSVDLEAVLNAFTLVMDENDALTASFDLSALLGETFGTVTLALAETDGAVALRLGDVTIAGVTVSDTELTLSAGDGEAAFSLDGAVDAAGYIDEIYALIAGKDYRLTADYSHYEKNAEGNDEFVFSVAADLRVQVLESGFALAGTLDVVYGDLSLPLNVTLAGDTVYLSLYNVKLSATFDELETAVEKIVQLAGLELPSLGGTQIDIPSLVAQLLRIDYNSVIEELTLTDSALTLKVDVDGILSALLGKTTDIDTITATYTKGAGFAAEVMGAALGFTASGETGAITAPADKDSYVTVTDVLDYVDAISAIAASDEIAFELKDLVTVIDGQEITFAVKGTLWFTEEGAQLKLSLWVGKEEIGLSYVGGNFRLGYGGYYMEFTEQELDEIVQSVTNFLSENGSAFTEDLSSVMALFGEDGIDLAALLKSLSLTAEQGGGEAIAADLAALLGGDSQILSLVADAGKNSVSLRLAEGCTLDLFGLRITSFSASVSVPETQSAPTAVGGKECANLFEFILRAYDTLTDTDLLSLSLTYAADGMSVDMKGAVQFEQNDTDTESNVIVNMQVEGVITSGASSYYMQAAIVRDKVYIYFSLVGFEESTYYADKVVTNAKPLRAQMTVSSLFDTATDAMPLIMSLMGLEKNELYYFNFVVGILSGSYQTINSDIFDQKSTQEWVDLILGIVDEYTGGSDAAQSDAAETKEGGMSVEFSLQERTLTVSGMGMEIVLGTGGTAPAAPEKAESYTDYSSLATLIGVMMDSITTSSPSYDGEGNPVLDDEGNPIMTADINSYYYLSGTASVSLWVIEAIEIDIYASAYIHDDFSVTVNLYLDIPGSIGTNEADVYLTIENGMVYMLQVKDGVSTYRVTTLDNFFGDILSHLTYLFSFNDFVAGFIPTEESGGSSSVTDIGNILTSYKFTDGAAQEWEIGLNLSSLTDNALGESTVTLKATDGVLKSLVFESMVYGILSLDATLNYVNPGESMGSAETVGDVTKNIAAETEELFGKAIDEADWSSTSYIEGRPAMLDYTLDGAVLGSQQVAYDTTTGKLLTDLDLPDLSGFNVGGYTYEWAGEPSGGSTSFAATKTANEYTVTLRSEYEIDGYEVAYTDGGVYVYELPYTYGTQLSLPVGAGSSDPLGYEIVGFTDESGAGITEVNGIVGDITLTAVWEPIEYTVTYSVFGNNVGTQTYHYGDTLELLASAQGYSEVVWESAPETVTDNMTVNAVYASVTVTLASDFAADGFTAGEGGYYKEYTLAGESAEAFDLSYTLSSEGYTQFGWWTDASGEWSYVTSLAGLDGETVWAMWVSDFTASVSSASKTNTSQLFAYKYDYAVNGSYAGGEVCGTVSGIIADAVGFVSSIETGGSVLYDSHSHSMNLSASGGSFSATAYLTSNAVYGNGYSYDYYYNKFNSYTLTLTVSYTCNIEGVSFAAQSVTLNGNF